MTTKASTTSLHRVIDANLNRLKEGIRVIEDVARYILDDSTLAGKLKTLRHASRIDMQHELLASRDSQNDVLKPSTKSEMTRSDLRSIVTANYKRAQESSRVLEETYKIIDPKQAQIFKDVRYELYALEKEHLSKDI